MTGAITEDGIVMLEDYLIPQPQAQSSGQENAKLDTSTFDGLVRRLNATKITAERQPLTLLARAELARLYPDLEKYVLLEKVSLEKAVNNYLYLKRNEADKQARYAELQKRYPEMDLSFLSMHNTIEGFGNHGLFGRGNPIRVSVPRFSVYPVYGGNMFGMGSEECDIQRNTTVYMRKCIVFFTTSANANGIDIPAIFREHIFRGTDFREFVEENDKEVTPYLNDYGLDKLYHFRLINLPRELRKIYEKLEGTALVSTFNALIPPETKEKIDQAVKDFREIVSSVDDPSLMMYFIAETKPEDWRQLPLTQIFPAPRYTAEPLVVLVADNRAFLVDHFDTTPLEDYVRKEFKR